MKKLAASVNSMSAVSKNAQARFYFAGQFFYAFFFRFFGKKNQMSLRSTVA